VKHRPKAAALLNGEYSQRGKVGQSALGIVLFSKQIRQTPTLGAKARALAREAVVFDQSASAFSPLSERTPSVELCLAHISGALGSTMCPCLLMQRWRLTKPDPF